MKYCFIINPASGKRATKEGLEKKILDAGAQREIDISVLTTCKRGDAQRYIENFCTQNPSEDIRFYVCGGDGTLCEAVNGIMKLPDRSRVSLGVIPVGTGNDFVRNFTEPDAFHDIDAQIDASHMDIDVMICNDFYSVNMINIGFDCQVVVKTQKYKKYKFVASKMAYIFGLVVTLIKKPGTKIRVAAETAEIKGKELLLTTFANGSFCGGGFKSNPMASLRDGMIDAMFIKNISRTRFLGLVGKYKKGTHLDGSLGDVIATEKAKEYRLEFDAPTQISVDGELYLVDKAKISCIPQAIRILIPRASVYAQG